MGQETNGGLEPMAHVAAAIAAGYVVASCDPWDPAAPAAGAVAQEYWHWCTTRGRPFVLIQTGGGPTVSVALDAAPLGEENAGPDPEAVSALLRLATAPGFVTTGHDYRPEAGGQYLSARAVPARLAPALAQELFCLAAGRGDDLMT